MSVEAAIVAHLKADSSLSAQVGGRVFPAQLPQPATLPAITYVRISRLATQHRSNMRAKHHRSRIQFDIWAASYASMQTVKSAFMDAMALLPQASNPRIDVALIQDDRDNLDADTERQRATIDYFVWHTGD